MSGRLLRIVGNSTWAFLKLSRDPQQSPCFLSHLSCGQTPIYDCLIQLTESLKLFKPGNRSQKDGTSAVHAPKNRNWKGNSNFCPCSIFCQYQLKAGNDSPRQNLWKMSSRSLPVSHGGFPKLEVPFWGSP